MAARPPWAQNPCACSLIADTIEYVVGYLFSGAARRTQTRPVKTCPNLGADQSMESEVTSPAVDSGRETKTLDRVVIRFAGDSGDGIQLTGNQFTNTTAVIGNDLSTLPDFPAEIRAPAGTLPGVSGFQIHFSSSDVFTPGDAPDVLVAMNPAALRVNLSDLKKGG